MIFYFTGTGNSLMAAKAVAQDGERLVNMAEAANAKEYRYDLPTGERIGFVFPVYCYTLSDVVLEFVRNLQGTGERYVFAVITCGGGIGGAGAFLAKELSDKGLPLRYVTPLLMPDCTVFYYNLASKEENNARLSDAEKRLSEIKADLDAKKERKAKGISSKALRPLYHFMSGTKAFRVTEDCIGCGMCARNCPDNAIRMEDGKPVWVKKNCIKCSACINRCPKTAIQYGKGTVKRNRYVNPILKGGKR